MVRKLLRNGTALFVSRQQSILGAAFILASMVALSRILGLVRTRLLAQYFPPSEIAVYFAAFRVPDFLYNVLVYGALSIAFVPIFSSVLAKKGKEEAFCFANNLVQIAGLLYAVFALVILVFADWVCRLVAPGFSPAEMQETVALTRALVFSQLFFMFGSMFSSILQVHKQFLVTAISGVLYNLGIILGIMLFAKMWGIWSAVIGVYFGAALFCLVQLPAVFALKFRFMACLSLRDKRVFEVIKLVGPRTFAIMADQLKMTATISLASLISARSVTLFTISYQLFLVPIGLFAASMAQAILPVLSDEYAKDDFKAFTKTLTVSLQQTLFFILPCAAILVVLKIPVVRLVFGADQFDWTATSLTSLTVAWLSVGLAFEAAQLLFLRAFYALHDTVTPVKMILVALAVDLGLAWYFTQVLGLEVWSLGLAATIGSGVGIVLLFVALCRALPELFSWQFVMPILKMSACALAMAFALYIPVKVLDQVVIDTTRTVNLIILTGIASGCGMIMYLFFTWVLKVREAFMLVEYAKVFVKKGKNLASKTSSQQ
jgi:putative peptidoglycan lipid II flippase